MANRMKTRLTLFDGRKAVDIWGDSNEGWTIAGEDPKINQAENYKFIPTLYRAVQLRAYSVSTMPFELYKGKQVFETSAEWKNKVGFLPNPTVLLQLIESALVMCGRAYIFRERSQAAIKALRYHLPASITVEINPVTGKIEYFERPVNNVTKKFKAEDYIYFWLPDPYVEIGPPLNYPAQAAANACGVLLSIDLFAAGFLERGAIKAMLLTVSGMPAEAERERLVAWWNRVVAGVKNAFGAQVINAEAVKPVVIGEGMKELENVTIGTEKREDVAIAVGIPMSILFANAANYATSQQDELNWLNKTIIPECEFIASVLNEQLWEPLGLRMAFLPETLDAMQEDEAARAVALGQLVAAGFDLITATEILGYELTDEQLARLMAEQVAKEEREREMAARLAGQPEAEAEEEEPEEEGEIEEKALADIVIDLRHWERKAEKSFYRKEGADVEFTSLSIPANMMDKIHISLAGCATADELRKVFREATVSIIHNAKGEATTTPAPQFGEALVALAAELKRANDLLEADGQAR